MHLYSRSECLPHICFPDFPVKASGFCSIFRCRWPHIESFNHVFSCFKVFLWHSTLMFCFQFRFHRVEVFFLRHHLSISETLGMVTVSPPVFGHHHSAWCYALLARFFGLPLLVTLGVMLWQVGWELWPSACTGNWGNRVLEWAHSEGSPTNLPNLLVKKKMSSYPAIS